MTRERFQTLADAYGADLGRWPEADRAAAQALVVADPSWTDRVLMDAAELDTLLHRAPPLRATADLTDRILAEAPKARLAPRWRWLMPAGLGAGLAAATAAGLLVGVQVSERAVATDSAAQIASDDLTLYAEDDA